MKKEEALSKCTFKVVGKKGAMLDNLMVVPMKYDYISRGKKNLFVATKGSVNGYRTYGIEATIEERDKPYGEYFNEQLKNKTLDTEVHFYTIDGQIHMNEKILACIACLNDDMIILLKEGYRWSIALIDYENLTITEVGGYSIFEYINSDYTNRRFVLRKNDKYYVVTFDSNSEVADIIQMNNQETVAMMEYGMVIKENGKYGFMNYQGEVILSCFWDDIRLHRTFIEVACGNKTAVYLYNGYCVFYDVIKSFEWYSIKGCSLFKVQDENGYFRLYSVNKQLLPREARSLDILSDGTIILNMQFGGYALIKYDIENDKLVPILPRDCFDNKAKLFDSMRFIYAKVNTTVEAVVGNRKASFDCDGKQLTNFKFFV